MMYGISDNKNTEVGTKTRVDGATQDVDNTEIHTSGDSAPEAVRLNANSYFTRYVKPSQSHESEVYYKNLAEAIADRNKDGDPVSVESYTRGGLLVRRGDIGIVVGLHDNFKSVLADKRRPASSVLNQLVEASKVRNPNTTIIDSLVVGSYDYQRYSVMASHLINKLDLFSGTVGPFALTMLNGYTLGISTITSEYVARTEGINPTIQSPNNLTFTITGSPTNTNGTRSDDENDDEKLWLACVAVVVEFVPIERRDRTYGSQPRTGFVPLITITDIITPLPSPELEMLALCVIINELTINQAWREPFYRLTNKCENVGYLYGTTVNSSNKIEVVECKNMDQVDDTLAELVRPTPLVAIDFAKGRPNAAITDSLAFRPNGDMIREVLANLFGGQLKADLNHLTIHHSRFYTGVYHEGDNIIDSRNITFLRQAAQTPQYIDSLFRLTNNYNSDDAAKSTLLESECGYDLTLMYRTFKVLLNVRVFGDIYDAMLDHYRIRIDRNGNSRSANTVNNSSFLSTYASDFFSRY